MNLKQQSRSTQFADDVLFLARDHLRLDEHSKCNDETTRLTAEFLKRQARLAVLNGHGAADGIVLTCGHHCATKIGTALYSSVRAMVPVLRNRYVFFQFRYARNRMLVSSTYVLVVVFMTLHCDVMHILVHAKIRFVFSHLQSYQIVCVLIHCNVSLTHIFSSRLCIFIYKIITNSVTANDSVVASLSVGLSTPEMPVNTLVGTWSHSIGLCSTGQVLLSSRWYSCPPGYGAFGVGSTIGVLVFLDGANAFQSWDGELVNAKVTFSVDGRPVDMGLQQHNVQQQQQLTTNTATTTAKTTAGADNGTLASTTNSDAVAGRGLNTLQQQQQQQ
jgi:hypothetical protein